MIYELTDSISTPELLWTVASALAAFYVFRLLNRALGNLKHLREMGWNSTREDAARISIVIFGSLFFIELVNVVIGIVAMTAAPPANDSSPTYTSYVVTTGFILEAAFIAGIAFLIDRMQVALVKKIEAGLEKADSGNRRRKGDA